MSVRSWVFLSILPILAISGGAFPARAAEEAPTAAAAPAPPSVSVVPATKRELIASVSVTGTLLPRETVVVGADVDGLRIEELLADEGDAVAAGAVLARLSTDMIDTNLAQNASQIARAEAARAQAESQIAQAEAASVEAEASLARARPLSVKGIVGQDVLDQRVSAAAGARAQLAMARQGVALAEADKTVLLAERRQIELRRDKAVIKAPTGGIVLSRAARLGSIVSSSSGGLFEIARDGLIELDADVGEFVLVSLAAGQKVEVTLAGGGAPIEGEIRLVSPMVDQTTRLGHVRIALPADKRLRTGMFARGTVEVARSRGVAVPRTAVVVDEEKAIVQVVQDGVIHTRRVTLGVASGDSVEITDGVAAGEKVVALAGTFVRDGDSVTPVDPAPGAVQSVEAAR